MQIGRDVACNVSAVRDTYIGGTSEKQVLRCAQDDKTSQDDNTRKIAECSATSTQSGGAFGAHGRFGRGGGISLAVGAPAGPENAQGSGNGNGEIDANHPGHFAAGEDGKNSGQGMKFQAPAHNARGSEIVLNKAPGAEQNRDQQDVMIAGKEGHSQNHDRSDQRSGQRYEFQNTSDDAQDSAIGQANKSQQRGEDRHGESSENELGADVVSQHGIQIGEQAAKELALPAAVHQVHHGFGKAAAIEQKEDGQDGHQDDPNGVNGELGGESAHVLGPGDDFLAMIGEPVLDVLLGVVAPALLGADLPGDLAAGEFFHPYRKGARQTPALSNQARTGKNNEHRQQHADGDVYLQHGARATAFGQAGAMLDECDQGIQQIGHQHGKNEGHENLPGGVDKCANGQEDENGEEGTGSALVPQGELFFAGV